ncbi:MAG: 30S ribosomal protein S12 methylthiotransferase RimO [Succinivibrionaceae bacterium]
MGSVNIGFISLGCPKNLVDSQNIITLLLKEGYKVVNSYDGADVVIINTCGFIESSIEESLDTIGEALSLGKHVIVTGCLGPRRDFILEKYPKVEAITGPHSAPLVLADIKRLYPITDQNVLRKRSLIKVPDGGIILTPNHYAYLKISEGCSHRCSFCIIPQIRGDLESFDAESILNQAESYVKRGVKELLVVAQDTSAYGVDKNYPIFRSYEKGDLYALTRELGKLGVWIRVHYAYPYPHVIKLIEQMAEGLVLPYMDVPLQHVNSRILKLMKRPGSHEKNLETINKWRSICPDLTIRSTFIVGFPGETEDEFSELLDFIAEAKLDRVGCFTYSPVLGAPANELPNPIPEDVKQDRYDRFMQLQQKISEEKLHNKVGKIEDVIIDEISEDGIVGRTKGDAPEIDGVIFLNNSIGKRINIGDIVKVEITNNDEYDLEGKIIC